MNSGDLNLWAGISCTRTCLTSGGLAWIESLALVPIGIYRDSFQRLAANVSQQLYSDEARCLLITSKMPDPVQLGLAILEPIKVPSKLFETARDMAHKIAGPCQKWWDERAATLAKGKPKQPCSETFAQAAARSSHHFWQGPAILWAMSLAVSNSLLGTLIGSKIARPSWTGSGILLVMRRQQASSEYSCCEIFAARR